MALDSVRPAASSSTQRGTAPMAPPPPPPPLPQEDSSEGFILDSGAAVHATARADLLSDPRPPEAGTVVCTRVVGTLPVAAVGYVETPRFVVRQVYHAPDLLLKTGCDAVIVSVRQLARQVLAVTFAGEACSVRVQSTGAVVGEGRLREHDGFYHLDYLRVPE